MPHLSRDTPYKGTTIKFEETMGQISQMLKEFGVIAIRWTDTPESIKGVELPVLEFKMHMEWEDMNQDFIVRMQAPMIPIRRRINNKYVNDTDKNASMRLLYWYIKARLEGVKFGLEDIFTALMPNIIHSLPDGGEAKLGETIKKSPKLILNTQLPDFTIKVKALPVEEAGYEH